MLEKPLASLRLGGITVNVMIGNILGMRTVFRNIYLDSFIVENIKVSLEMSTLIDKTDGQNRERREDYWRRTLKTYAPFGLNVEYSV